MKPIITESPRDAIQGLHYYIPTQTKVDYINQLLKVGFDIIDIGSFVSEKTIPQLKDTADVLKKIDISNTKSKIMVLVANTIGIETAMNFEEISILAFPFSISPTFSKLNINADLQKAFQLVEFSERNCDIYKKTLKVYIPMAFGNPYEDEYNIDILFKSVVKLHAIGIKYITLSDVIGVANSTQISKIYSQLISDFPDIEFGIHLHTTPNSSYEKLDAAYLSGCRSFDAVINGMGGCPMTGYELLSNLNTYDLFEYFKINNIETKINIFSLNDILKKNKELFTNF